MKDKIIAFSNWVQANWLALVLFLAIFWMGFLAIIAISWFCGYFLCYLVSVKSSGVSPPKQKGQPSLADH